MAVCLYLLRSWAYTTKLFLSGLSVMFCSVFTFSFFLSFGFLGSKKRQRDEYVFAQDPCCYTSGPNFSSFFIRPFFAIDSLRALYQKG